ncbi:hydroxysteroid 11-beta-dehydrogenase 1-like protein [Myotis lucifugus]|uniref:hydroxysteroid 11-beta-dehydrogenase 1-like protein n=1 Tax=Myotis lucifugus TaxID=59463 RepID=UPI000CCC2DF0|nr:hydroxysteroid 11-beta-dehydrogenase 1-like protein [Myotis lucifugus]
MKVLLLTGLGALFFTYYWADNFDPASLQGARVLLTGASAGVGEELAYHYARLGSHLVLTAHTEVFLQKVVGNCRKLGAPKVFFIAADMASREVPELVVQFALDKLGEGRGLGLDLRGRTRIGVGGVVRVPASFSSPYSAAKFALDSFFGALQRELHVQDVNVAITRCVLGLQDRASAKEGVRGVTRAQAAPGPKAALAVIRGGATRVSHVFYPWRFHVLCLLRAWLPHPRAWFVRQELNVTAAAAA